MARLCTLSLVLLFLMAGAGAAQPHETAVIQSTSGEVSVLRKTMAYRAGPAFILQEGDVVITGASGYAGLLFNDGTVITLGPFSDFQIRNYVFNPREHAYFFNFFMNRGSMIYNSGKIGKLSPQSVRLSTPEATVGIRGTRFIMDLGSNRPRPGEPPVNFGGSPK